MYLPSAVVGHGLPLLGLSQRRPTWELEERDLQFFIYIISNIIFYGYNIYMENNYLTGLYKLNITGLRALLPQYVDNAEITKQINDLIAKKQQKSKNKPKKPNGFVSVSNNINSRIQFDDEHPIHNIDVEKCASCEKVLSDEQPKNDKNVSLKNDKNVSLQSAIGMLRHYYKDRYNNKPTVRPRETRFGHISGISYTIASNGNIESLTFDLE